MKKLVILVLTIVLSSCTVREDSKPRIEQIEHAQEDVNRLKRELSELTLLHHIYVLEYENLHDERLKSALEALFEEQDYSTIDSLLLHTKIDAKEALDKL